MDRNLSGKYEYETAKVVEKNSQRRSTIFFYSPGEKIADPLHRIPHQRQVFVSLLHSSLV